MQRGIPALWGRRELLWVLVLRDLQARSKQAFLGYVWIVLQPLLLTGAFTFLVERVLGMRVSDTPYPVFLMAGLIPWHYFTTAVGESTDSLVNNMDLVRQVYFPREALVLYPLVARLLDVGIAGLVLAGFMFAFRVPLSPWVALAPLLLLIQATFMAAVALGLAALNVAWRDVGRALPLVLSLLLYAVPVLYPGNRVPEQVGWLYFLNPMAVVIETFRTALLGPGEPNLGLLGLAAGVSLALLLVAQRLFALFDTVLADVI
ncbi:MAG: ABC transporter permease [Chloroflexi bacterium]|nr:ABC transporter permease [Chloroflexota bacterium]